MNNLLPTSIRFCNNVINYIDANMVRLTQTSFDFGVRTFSN